MTGSQEIIFALVVYIGLNRSWLSNWVYVCTLIHFFLSFFHHFFSSALAQINPSYHIFCTFPWIKLAKCELYTYFELLSIVLSLNNSFHNQSIAMLSSQTLEERNVLCRNKNLSRTSILEFSRKKDGLRDVKRIWSF